jgi:pimeloyl-ACP methyl ester carboxylesterase
MIDDVGAALQFIRSQGVNGGVFLAGASLGANVALNYASLTNSVSGVILLSPGIDYQGIQTGEAIQRLKKEPVLLVASEADKYAFLSSVRLKNLYPNATFWSDVKPGHGVQMFDDNLLQRIKKWLQKNN